jgi:hypothetical protein
VKENSDKEHIEKKLKGSATAVISQKVKKRLWERRMDE